MPNFQDATVVLGSHSTSGNGGRKLVRLSNGWIVAAVHTSGTGFNFYVSKDSGSTFSLLTTRSDTSSTQGWAIASSGNIVHFIYTQGNTTVIAYSFDAITISATLASGQVGVIYAGNIDTGQTALGAASLAVNEAGTELHAAWSSKNGVYLGSLNTRYAKGVINGDGSVTWGEVTQLTISNSNGSDVEYPTIIVNGNSYPVVIHAWNSGTAANAIMCKTFNGSSWNTGQIGSAVYSSTGRYQYNPSAIFVPQSVNGLVNGRIWVAWFGTDATITGHYNIRVSYSDDGGSTWSSMVRITNDSVSQMSPSITANKNNEIFVVWNGADPSISASIDQIRCRVWSEGTWGSPTTKTANTTAHTAYPSTLYDLNIDYTQPLFIYRNNQSAKVGFYGTWTEISVPEGSIGTKTDRSSLLAYSIASEVMTTITEKVNGVVVGTKTATSGQALTVALDAAEWDAVRFGKYADAVGGLNTLTIEMGGKVWTYTFDKRLAAASNLEQVAKAIQDADSAKLPSVKAELSSAIAAKGGTVAGGTWDDITAAVAAISLGKKNAAGTVTSSTGVLTFTRPLGAGSAGDYWPITVSASFGFVPSFILAYSVSQQIIYDVRISDMEITTVITRTYNSGYIAQQTISFQNAGNAYVTAKGFRLPASLASVSYNWIAIE